MLKKRTFKNYDILIYAILIIGLYLTSRYSYLLFHSIAEIFSIVITFGIFMFAWNSRKFMNNSYLLTLGIAYLFIGSIDLLHTLAYKGMGIFTGYGADLPTQLWIAARYLESMTLLIAPIFFIKKANPRILFAGYTTLTAVLVAVIFYFKIFPDCFIEGSGLTSFKIFSEYVISLILLGALFLVYKNRVRFSREVSTLLILSIIFTIGAELAFTFYISVYGLSNLIGHIFKIISFYLIYKAVIETGLRRPYSLLMKDLKENETKLNQLNQNLENRVEERTAELQKLITERKSAEQRVRTSRNMLQTVINGISDPLILVDHDMILKMVNNAAKKYLGIEDQDSKTIAFKQVFTKEEKSLSEDKITESVARGKQLTFEQTGLMNDNRIEKVTIYPINEIEHKIDGAIIHIEDITRTKMIERQMVQQERLASLGFLVAGIAHEINNPINFVTFNLPILREYFKKIYPILDQYSNQNPKADFLGMNYPEFRADINTLIDNMEHGAIRVSSIMTDLRDFSSEGKNRANIKVNIGQVVEKSISICHGKIKKMISDLKTHIPDNAPEIVTDPGRLEQVLINLLINAAQACDKKNSWIKLEIENKDDAGEWVTISVIDNGRGMDQQTLKNIFNPFFTTKPIGEGTGLGLFICHNIVEGLGGRIEVESSEGAGSTFKVLLPVAGQIESDSTA